MQFFLERPSFQNICRKYISMYFFSEISFLISGLNNNICKKETSYCSAMFLRRPPFQNIWKKKIWFFVQWMYFLLFLTDYLTYYFNRLLPCVINVNPFVHIWIKCTIASLITLLVISLSCLNTIYLPAIWLNSNSLRQLFLDSLGFWGNISMLSVKGLLHNFLCIVLWPGR